MALNAEEMVSLVSKVTEKIRTQLYAANNENSLNDLLKKISCSEFIKTNVGYQRDSKILVIGDSAIPEYEIRNAALELGVDDDLLELHLDYKKNKHFDFKTLKNNVSVSDVIFGPIAHKSKGMGDTSSIIAEMQNNPDEWPNAVIASSSNELKITKKSFKDALLNTRAYNNSCF